MANDAPKLHGFTFTHQPATHVWWESKLIIHTLSDGTKAVYNKGFVLKGILEWGEGGWLNQTEYSAVEVMYNQLTATAKFYPRPDTQATRVFNVQITNEFNFMPHDGMVQKSSQLYGGSIEFESSIGDIVATATAVY